jgi:hypothetical protein
MLSSMNWANAIALLAGLPLLTACREPAPKGFREVYQQRQVQESALAAQPIDRQLDFYLYAVRHTHPPDRGFSLTLAQLAGRSIVPAVLERLEKEQNEFSKVYLILLLEDIAHYSNGLGGDSTVMRSLRSIVEGMRDNTWRSMATKSVQEIRRLDRHP